MRREMKEKIWEKMMTSKILSTTTSTQMNLIGMTSISKMTLMTIRKMSHKKNRKKDTLLGARVLEGIRYLSNTAQLGP